MIATIAEDLQGTAVAFLVGMVLLLCMNALIDW
jgi:hypothetical protein